MYFRQDFKTVSLLKVGKTAAGRSERSVHDTDLIEADVTWEVHKMLGAVVLLVQHNDSNTMLISNGKETIMRSEVIQSCKSSFIMRCYQLK